MAAGRAAYLVRITRSQAGEVLIVTSIDGTEKSTTPLSEASPQALRSAITVVSRDTRNYAATHNVVVATEIANELSEQVIAFTVNPAGEVSNQSTGRLASTPPSRPTTKPNEDSPAVAKRPAGAHRVTGFTPATALPSRRTPPPAPEPEPEPEPEPRMAWAESVDYEEPDPEPRTISPALVPVTDRKIRIKKPAKDDDRGSLISEIIDKFKALTVIKKIGVILGVVIVLFLGVRILGGGGGDYAAVCVDQRTGLVNLDPAPCQDGTVRFFVWYYIKSSDDLPKPGTDYSSSPGSFDKPTSGKITYP